MTYEKNLLQDSAVFNEPDNVFTSIKAITQSNETPSAPGFATLKPPRQAPVLISAPLLSTMEIFK